MPGSLHRFEPAPSLPERAAADLRYIRGAMERSGSFTAVPGRGGMGMGLVALVAAALARPDAGAQAWLTLWGSAALLAVGIGALSLHAKATREGVALLAGPGRRFLLCLGPSLLVGALLTFGLARLGAFELLPAAWLLCYGAGVVSAGANSIPIVPATGVAFLVCGTLALLVPAGWGDALMALGFGGIHLVSGFLVARRHGG